RDIKPSNALVTARDFVYLIDFGIAHDGAATRLTSTGMMVGTLAYMAPERFTAGMADARSDIYALACVLHECLTARQPFPGDSLEQQIAGHLTMDPPRPSEQRSEVPAGLDGVIAAGMAKDPEQRFQTGQELAIAARDALTAAPSRVSRTPAPRPAPTRPVPPPSSRPPAAPPVPPRSGPPRPSPRPAPPQRLLAPAPRTEPAAPDQRKWWLAAGVLLVVAVGSISVLTTVISNSISQTHSAATSSEPATQPATPSAPAAPASQFFQTPWGTRCQVDADAVLCDTCEPGLLLDTPHG